MTLPPFSGAGRVGQRIHPYPSKETFSFVFGFSRRVILSVGTSPCACSEAEFESFGPHPVSATVAVAVLMPTIFRNSRREMSL